MKRHQDKDVVVGHSQCHLCKLCRDDLVEVIMDYMTTVFCAHSFYVSFLTRHSWNVKTPVFSFASLNNKYIGANLRPRPFSPYIASSFTSWLKHGRCMQLYAPSFYRYKILLGWFKICAWPEIFGHGSKFSIPCTFWTGNSTSLCTLI